MLLQRYPLLRNARFWSLLLLQLLVLFQSPTPFTQALTSTLSAALQRPVPPFTSSFLTATAQNVIYDGPEWTSLQECLNCRNAAADCGRMTIVVGTTKEGGDKVVGVVVAEQEKVDEKKRHKTVELNENNYKIYKESMAVLPAKIKDQDAIQTMIAALSGVYCTVPKVEGVGGAEKDESKMAVQGKVRESWK